MKRTTVLTNQRGFSLMELVIVMMVLAIMTVMVTSFTIMVNGWSKVGTYRYNLLQSQRMAGDYLRRFVSAYDTREYVFATADDGSRLVARNRTDNSTASFGYNGTDSIEFVLPTGQGYCTVEHIIGLQFGVRTASNGQQLIAMTLFYQLPNTAVSMKGEDGTYDILVSTRCTEVA